MVVPLSWLKEYVDITLTPKELGEKLTEVGLGCEKITHTSDDTIFELEITPNRPDCLSIIGITREIAAIENKKIRYPQFKTNLKPSSHLPCGKLFPLTIKTDTKINPRFTGIIISGIKVGESPKWLKDRLAKMNQRPINNIVDITNYVMLELGNPIHAFDYDKIQDHIITVHKTKGGETFKSVDAIDYRLPENAVVISDKEKIIDLCGIKGGFNSGTFETTKNIFIRIPVEIPTLIRRVSQHLSLRSEASSIFERGADAGGTIDALKRTVDLILEIAGGEIASNIYDIKEQNFKPWKLTLRISRLNQILGIKIAQKRIINILDSLNLNPHVIPSKRSASKDPDIIECTIPTYRNDLKIEEDLIEEVARLYGYNNFTKTLPIGEMQTEEVPYFKNYAIDDKAKQILISSGFSEIYTYSLIAESDLVNNNIDPENTLKIDNAVSRDFEYLRPTLKINLLKALTQNKPNFKNINLFELGKVYIGKNIQEAKEYYFLSGISNNKSYFQMKGLLEVIFEKFGIKEDSTKFIQILQEGIFFEINFSKIINKANFQKKFIPLLKYPPIVEDLSIIADENIKTSELISEIKNQSPLVADVSLLDQFEDTKTFHIVYQDKNKNLTGEEVAKIRSKIFKSLKEKFHVGLK